VPGYQPTSDSVDWNGGHFLNHERTL